MMFAQDEMTRDQAQRPDMDVLADVRDAMWQDDTIRNSDRNSLEVEVREGEVILSGHMASALYRQHLEDVVMAVPGVRALRNEIVFDTELANAVSQALATDPRTRPYLLRVGAFHGWIHLNGEVTDSRARAAAEEIAAQVPSVRGILTLPELPGELVGQRRRALQPRLDSPVYADDGPAGTVVQVVINPRNRLVSQIGVAVQFELEGKTVRGQYPVPVEAIDHVSDSGVFLYETLDALAARPAFEESSFPLAPQDWRPPFPYAARTVRLDSQHAPSIILEEH